MASWRSNPTVGMLAPSASYGGAALKLPGQSRPHVHVDEHIVTPETTREEMVRGERLVALPALAPHGDQHFSLDYVLGAHVAEDYVGSTDLLTRAAHNSDFASDTCVRRQGIDPTTGHRYLEELAFEVVFTQTARAAIERAEDLSRRGVRRVVAIFVVTSEVKEWDPQLNAFRTLDLDSSIVDASLMHPLSVRAILDKAVADDAVARALESKGNPVIAKLKHESEARGEARGEARAMAVSVLKVLAMRGVEIPTRERAIIEQTTHLERLQLWLERALTAAKAADVIRSDEATSS